MQRNFYLACLSVFLMIGHLSAQTGAGTLRGKITDKATGELLPFVNVVVLKGETQVGGGSSDFDGNYTVKPIPPGKYDILVSFVGYNTQKRTGVTITADQITFVDFGLESGVDLDEVEVTEYVRPLIDKDGAIKTTVTREEISKLPGRSAASIAATAGGTQTSADGSISVRGARDENTFYYIDGIKVRGSTSLPKAAIEEVSVLTGGIPANYGDVTGGIIAVTTRGASSTWFGGIDIITSGFRDEDGNGIGLDPYAQTQVEGVLSGPILFKKDAEGNNERPIVGFFLSGNYRRSLDGRPSVIGNYRLTDAARERLNADAIDYELQGFTQNVATGLQTYISPDGNIVPSSVTQVPNIRGIYNSSFITEEDIEYVDARQNSETEGGSLSAKLDFNPTKNTILSLGGTFDLFTTRAGAFNSNAGYVTNQLMNSANNPFRRDITGRGFIRFTQRFADNSDGESSGGLKNAFYSVMIDYTRNTIRIEDDLHRDNLFNYGYVGRFENTIVNEYTFNPDTLNGIFVQSGFRDLNMQFTPDDINSDYASITSELFEFYEQNGLTINNLNQVVAANGLRNGDPLQDLYGLYNNIGWRNNGYQLFSNEQARFTATGSADIGNHAISLGVEFEQRIDRGFSTSPRGLWTIGRQYVNSHLTEIDYSVNPSIDFYDGFAYYTYDRLISLNQQTTFDRNLRTSLGLDPNGADVINLDGLSPDQLSLDMFSPDELLNQGNNLVSYYGYDAFGNVQAGRPTIDDFFTERTVLDDGRSYLSRPIAAYEPNYIAMFIMDKFAFDDIIFNVGLRADRFDANQPVLKDQYIVGEGHTVGTSTLFTDHPNSIGEDFAIYVNDLDNPTSIVGYRDGDQWYSADGVPLSDGTLLRTSEGIAPYLVDPNAIQDSLNSGAFTDYVPQWNIMPRVSFSFPISDEAVFFAHYDILTQRPTDRNRLNPIQYLYLQNQNELVNNPNLQPTRTIDYELGFQQVLGKSSSLKVAGFYREMRNMIQARLLADAFPRQYVTFDNIDFGTIKGLTLSYDLRRTGNITLRAAYTLQFADATGSSSTSGVNLANSQEPALRIISPTDQDQRHVLITAFDFRYGEGSSYNGPMIGNTQILKNFGVNIVGNLGSGTPYSQQLAPTAEALISGGGQTFLEGTINGSRLPWQYRIDLQVDKSFTLRYGKENEEGNRGKSASLNVYLLVNNLLNTQNIISVYRYTGNPDDDGYLSAAQFQAAIQGQFDPESYANLYGLKVNDQFNYGLARTVQLGLRLDF